MTALASATLIEQLNAAHQAAERCAREAVRHAFEAGRLLLEARELVPHGQWLAWFREHFRGSERTAQAYMRLARELPALTPPDAQRVADLPLREALRALADGEPAASPDEAGALRCELEDMQALLDVLASAPPSDAALRLVRGVIRRASAAEQRCEQRRQRAVHEVDQLAGWFTSRGWRRGDVDSLADGVLTFDEFMQRRAAA